MMQYFIFAFRKVKQLWVISRFCLELKLWDNLRVSKVRKHGA